jgi:hypothetical protein
MSQITIQCRLFADETARRYLWELMSDRNTPLVNELLRLVAIHSDFPTWRSSGKIPTKEFTKLAKTLDKDSRFNNQPAKFRISAEKTALYTFKSWVAIQKRTQWRLKGKISWLRMLRTNEESIADCGQDLEQIRLKAQSLLLQYQSSEDSAESRGNLRTSLYQAYDETEEALSRSAIAYLLRNRCQIPSETEENVKEFLKYRYKIKNQIKSLTQQLENRLPKGRDLTGERFLNKQDNYIKRLQSTLDKIERPFERPSRLLDRGQSNIIVAVSMGLQSPVTAIAIDITTQEILAYRNTKQLLGDNYRLVNRQRNLQTQQRHSSHKAQKQGLSRQFSNSELGEHLDRLFAKAIVELAQTYRAGSIALPKLDQIRLIIQSEVDAMAQQKIPDYLEGQKKYAKQVRINLHNWSYNRLSESIISKAAQFEIAIEYGTQPARASPNVREASRNENRAKEIALSAYAKRTVS